MDYKKKYKAALAIAKDCLKDGTITSTAIDYISTIFPELAESEDEKIRKGLIKGLSAMRDIHHHQTFSDDAISINDALVWLEMQGTDIDINPSEFEMRLNKLLKQFESLSKEDIVSSLSFYLNVIQNDGTYKAEEKQGEQKDFAPKDKCAGCNNIKGCMACVDGDNWAHYYYEDKQKHINDTDEEVVEAVKDTSVLDMVEPRFHKGDWITNDRYIKMIVGIGTKSYKPSYYMFKDGTTRTIHDIDKKWHLWTIADAKDGDILATPPIKGSENDGQIFIFKGINNRDYVDNCIEYYCRVCEGVFYENKTGFMGTTSDTFYPATKEQRDTLMEAMHDAGYEWDAEKKELKEIEKKPVGKPILKFKVGDMVCKKKDNSFCATINSITDTVYLCDVFDSDGDYDDDYAFLISEQDEYELVEKIKLQSAWSEEDEKMYKIALSCIETLEDISNGKNMHADVKEWLKFLKNRIGG